MIFDNIKNAKLYYGLGENFAKGFEFLKNADLSKMPVGKTEIDGKNVYVSISEYNTKDVAGDFEAHDNYADIQFIISGFERIDYAERKDCALTVLYNSEKDILKLSCDNFTPISIKAGEFAVFFPEDAHRPNITDKINSFNKKAVIKVKVK